MFELHIIIVIAWLPETAALIKEAPLPAEKASLIKITNSAGQSLQIQIIEPYIFPIYICISLYIYIFIYMFMYVYIADSLALEGGMTRG